MLEDGLNLLDRGTLRAWRVANLLVWTGLAILAEVILWFAAWAAVHLYAPALRDSNVAYVLLVGLASSGLAGLAAGSLIGTHVYRWPAALSAVAGLALVLVIALLVGLQATAPTLARVFSALVAVPFAVLAARVTSRHRQWTRGSARATAGGSLPNS